MVNSNKVTINQLAELASSGAGVCLHEGIVVEAREGKTEDSRQKLQVQKHPSGVWGDEMPGGR